MEFKGWQYVAAYFIAVIFFGPMIDAAFKSLILVGVVVLAIWLIVSIGEEIFKK